ncbi:MAG TPA: hypothetical protein VGJ28_09970 [Micromonosporaceae bacterium]
MRFAQPATVAAGVTIGGSGVLVTPPLRVAGWLLGLRGTDGCKARRRVEVTARQYRAAVPAARCRCQRSVAAMFVVRVPATFSAAERTRVRDRCSAYLRAPTSVITASVASA